MSSSFGTILVQQFILFLATKYLIILSDYSIYYPFFVELTVHRYSELMNLKVLQHLFKTLMKIIIYGFKFILQIDIINVLQFGCYLVDKFLIYFVLFTKLKKNYAYFLANIHLINYIDHLLLIFQPTILRLKVYQYLVLLFTLFIFLYQLYIIRQLLNRFDPNHLLNLSQSVHLFNIIDYVLVQHQILFQTIILNNLFNFIKHLGIVLA